LIGPLQFESFRPRVLRYPWGDAMLLQHKQQVEEPHIVSVWADRDERARLVVDNDLIVKWSNVAAIRFLQEPGLFSIIAGTLLVHTYQARQRFIEFVRSSASELSTLCLQDEDGVHVICTAINLSNSDTREKTGITLRRSNIVVPIGIANLAAAFHLTPGECNIVKKLFSGHTAEQIGDELSLSIGTIRMHIRHIYEKLDVSSREAMFHKLMPFMLVR
jgi:DNA-binding CsgD family transcriptional regulator